MTRLVLVVLCAAVLFGCGTKYQDMGFTGGVAAEQITSDTWRIRARANAYTNQATVQDFVLLKAAETTQAAGATHFQIITAADASRASTVVTPGSSTTTFVGNQAMTFTAPGSVDTVIKPGQDVFIRVLKSGQQAPGAISAEEIIRYTGPRVRRE